MVEQGQTKLMKHFWGGISRRGVEPFLDERVIRRWVGLEEGAGTHLYTIVNIWNYDNTTNF